jgi:D-alanyl-D-alanine carboxypeptidase
MVYAQDRRGRWSVSSGTRELGTDRPIRPRDRVRVASNTKMFVAAVVLQLVEDGEVALDAPVEEYVPGLVAGNGYDGTKITVRQLLQHTSGMADYIEDVLADPGAGDRPWQPSELVAIGLSHPPLFAPGTGWAYSNTGYIVLGMIVEAVTGNDLGDEITDRLIRPLGLGSTTYPDAGDKRIRGPHAHGYYAFPGQPVMDITELEPSLPGAAGSLISTGPDLTRFVRALLSGKVLRRDLLAEMRTTVPAEGPAYGLGIREIPLPCGGVAWGHGGNMPGFDSFTAATEDGRAVFVVVNGHLADGSVADVRTAAETALC